MSQNLHQQLQYHFGFSNFRPGQEEAITHILSGQNTLVVMPEVKVRVGINELEKAGALRQLGH
ncbi:MAG: hypothetical protein ONB05_05675 [candidate division KSB1 bacterium]|nr:hypothetical protein [candidate division KSB1 bacterium]